MTAGSVARFATDAERVGWNQLIAANPDGGEVWQSSEYLLVKRRRSTYQDRYVIVERPGKTSVAVGILAKRVPFLGEWWHVPAGPSGDGESETLDIAQAVASFALKHKVFLVKVEPRLCLEAAEAFTTAGFLPTVRVIPNDSTVLLNITGSIEEVFARLGKKARNSINRAKRDGIIVESVPATDENCAVMYGLLSETAEDSFVLRAESYYRDYWQTFGQAGTGQLFFAQRDNEVVAGAFAMILGEKCTYKDGASLRKKTAYGASHALQWSVIRWAHERGVTLYDFCGAPPTHRTSDRTHPMFGVGQFKRSFASETTDYVGAFDLPLKPVAFRIWKTVGERIARRWSLAVHKDPYF